MSGVPFEFPPDEETQWGQTRELIRQLKLLRAEMAINAHRQVPSDIRRWWTDEVTGKNADRLPDRLPEEKD